MNKRFITVTIWSALLTFVRMLSGIIISKIVAVYTGPGGVAMLGQLQSLITISNGVLTSPVGNGIVKYTAEESTNIKSNREWWRAAIIIALTLYVVYLPCLLIFSKTLSELFFKTGEYYKIIIYSGFVMPFSIANVALASILNGKEQYRRFIISGMISVIISTLVVVTLVPVLHLYGALIVAASGNMVAGVVLIFYCRKIEWFSFESFFGKTTRDKIKKITSYMLMAIASAICMPGAILAVRKILIDNVGWQGAGEWQAVWKISEVYLSVITLSLSTYVLPRLSKLKSASLIAKEVNKLTVFILPIVISFALAIFFLRDVIINVLFTKEFLKAEKLFLYQLVGDVIKIAAFVYAYPLIAQAKVKFFIALEIIFSIGFVVLAYILINSLGLQGANYAYVISYILYFIICLVYVNFLSGKFCEV